MADKAPDDVAEKGKTGLVTLLEHYKEHKETLSLTTEAKERPE